MEAEAWWYTYFSIMKYFYKFQKSQGAKIRLSTRNVLAPFFLSFKSKPEIPR